MDIFPESMVSLNALKLGFSESPELDVAVLVDTTVDRHRNAEMWEFLSVLCGTGGAVSVAIGTLGQWIATRVTTIRIRVDGAEFVIESRNADEILPQVAEALKESIRQSGPSQGELPKGSGRVS
jgi:hypothetical protein